MQFNTKVDSATRVVDAVIQIQVVDRINAFLLASYNLIFGGVLLFRLDTRNTVRGQIKWCMRSLKPQVAIVLEIPSLVGEKVVTLDRIFRCIQTLKGCQAWRIISTDPFIGHLFLTSCRSCIELDVPANSQWKSL